MKGTGCRLNGKIETVNTTGKDVSFCGLNLVLASEQILRLEIYRESTIKQHAKGDMSVRGLGRKIFTAPSRVLLRMASPITTT